MCSPTENIIFVGYYFDASVEPPGHLPNVRRLGGAFIPLF